MHSLTERCNCCNRNEAQVWTNGGPACDWCRNNCVQEPMCDQPHFNAMRVLEPEEEGAALERFRPLP